MSDLRDYPNLNFDSSDTSNSVETSSSKNSCAVQPRTQLSLVKAKMTDLLQKAEIASDPIRNQHLQILGEEIMEQVSMLEKEVRKDYHEEVIATIRASFDGRA